MKRKNHFAIALVTAPDLKIARKLAKSILQSRLAACVNLLPQIESHYWWRGKVEKSSEVLLLLKTEKPLVAKLQKFVEKCHPYDTPEFIVLKINSGSKRYLEWLADSVK